VEDRLRLTTVTRLLSVVTALALRKEGGLARLVLRHLVRGVLLAGLALAIGSAGLGDVDHGDGCRECCRAGVCGSLAGAGVRSVA